MAYTKFRLIKCKEVVLEDVTVINL